MNKKILLFCLMIFCGIVLHAYDDSIDFENPDNIEIEETTTIYQDLEAFYNSNELNEKNLTLLLKKYDIYNIDELIYLLNNDKNTLTQETNALKRAMNLKSFLLGCVGTYLGYTALSKFINKEQRITNAVQITKDVFVDLRASFEHDSQDQNLYTVLDVTKTDDIDTIRKKYKNLSIQYHPDRNFGVDTTQKMQQITNAKNILCDAEKKSQYDICLESCDICKDDQALKTIVLPEITKVIYKEITKYSIFSIGAFSIIPLIVRSNNKRITKNNDLLKNLNTIIQHIEHIQSEELV